SAHTFTEEMRLVSTASPANVFDYVLGVFYEKQERNGAWNIANPGSLERSVAQGCTGAIYYGSTFPNCLLTSGPNDVVFRQLDTQNFQDKSVFGELTWHFMTHGQITFGARHFSQEFTDAQSYDDWAFPTFLPAVPHSSPASKTVGKVNPSYEYAKDQFVYALWSQGFRRGGANSVPLTGPFQESPALASYQPDKTNNYEVGLKGRFDNGLSYTFAGFETSGPLFLPGLAYSVGFSYADAKLTSDFFLPANVGGVVTAGALSGKSGQQLPGSPKTSATATLNYDRNLTPGYDLTLSLNGTYRSAVLLGLASAEGNTPVQQSSSYAIANFSATVNHKPWRAVWYVTNLLDKQEILVPPYNPGQVGGLTNDYVVNRPRETGLRIAYTF